MQEMPFLEIQKIRKPLINHGLCGSNKLLYKHSAKLMEKPKFRPPSQLPHFSTDLNETWNQERYPGYHTIGKIWLTWDDGMGYA